MFHIPELFTFSLRTEAKDVQTTTQLHSFQGNAQNSSS